MDLKQIEYFVHVAELGSFTKAAVMLDVAQSAISRQIRQLEVELQQSLLLRNGRGVTMTEAGKALLEHGLGILHQVERTREIVSKAKGALSGHVVVGLPPSLSRLLTVPLTRAFHQKMPHASLAICEGLSINMQESLRNGRMDIALLYTPTPTTEIDIIPISNEPLYLIERATSNQSEDVVSLTALADKPLVIPSKPHSIRMLVESALAEQGYHPNIALEIDSVPAILELVCDGLGCAVLSQMALVRFEKAELLHMRQIGSPPLTTRLALATSARRAMTLTQHAMLDLIQTLMQRVTCQHDIEGNPAVNRAIGVR